MPDFSPAAVDALRAFAGSKFEIPLIGRCLEAGRTRDGCGAQAPAMFESHTSFVVTGTLLPPRETVGAASPTPARQ